jgi:hypothetical protein
MVIVEKLVEWRLTGETEVLWENLPQRHFCPSQNLKWLDPVLNPGRRGGKPATIFFYYYEWGGTLGTAATTGLLYQPRMIGDGDCGDTPEDG